MRAATKATVLCCISPLNRTGYISKDHFLPRGNIYFLLKSCQEGLKHFMFGVSEANCFFTRCLELVNSAAFSASPS